MLFCRHPALDGAVSRLLGPVVVELLNDPAVQEISANFEAGQMRLFADYGAGPMCEIPAELAPQALTAVARLLATANGRSLERQAPFLNTVLLNGCRIHMALPPVTDGPSFSIRTHRRILRPPTDFMTAEQARFMEAAVAARLTILVAGGTNSGKTTLLNSLINLIPVTERLLIIEDAGEIQARAGNVVRRFATVVADLRRQVFESLRDRPDRIIVGEVRGSEARDMLEAAVTGHAGGLSTIHASDCAGALTRLQRLADCDERLVREALDLVVFVERQADGRRAVTEIKEL